MVGGIDAIAGTRPIDLRDLLARMRTIAIVGLSADATRPSNEVARFLAEGGYACYGVNPALAGRSVHGIPVAASLGEIGRPLDMIDIFRASHAVMSVVRQSLALDPRPQVIWMQLGVEDVAAKAAAEAAGLVVVMNNCPKIVLSGRQV